MILMVLKKIKPSNAALFNIENLEKPLIVGMIESSGKLKSRIW